MLQELPTGVVSTESTTRELSADRAFSDLAVRTARKQPTRSRTASIAVGDILKLQVHAVLLATRTSDRCPHCLAFENVLLRRRQMNGASVTRQTTICDHRVHHQNLAAVVCAV